MLKIIQDRQNKLEIMQLVENTLVSEKDKKLYKYMPNGSSNL